MSVILLTFPNGPHRPLSGASVTPASRFQEMSAAYWNAPAFSGMTVEADARHFTTALLRHPPQTSRIGTPITTSSALHKTLVQSRFCLPVLITSVSTGSHCLSGRLLMTSIDMLTCPPANWTPRIFVAVTCPMALFGQRGDAIRVGEAARIGIAGVCPAKTLGLSHQGCSRSGCPRTWRTAPDWRSTHSGISVLVSSCAKLRVGVTFRP